MSQPPSSSPRSVKEIFADALGLPADDRAAFVERECGGDERTKARVMELLAVHERGAREFMAGATVNSGDSPSLAPPASVESQSQPTRNTSEAPTIVTFGEQPGTRIGHYKLLQLIGEGGFGSVYMAEQVEPVIRRVALKIIKAGMDTKQVIARFEAERQALAMMDHPCIARVLDAGGTPSGRPYFVMELVRGEPITAYCDRHNLSIPERLDLFTQVCAAVQHAHQKGIIHRDIKPSNVLIASADGKPLPKVIDFGIAKATAARLTEKTYFTEFGQLIGTPEYMSPEQAEMTSADIDTRSDVYSLGVLLYELLTGTTPFDTKRLRSAAFREIQRIIREDEPLRPSTRLSTMESLPSIAAQRGLEPARLGRALRGDLDWITMKALEKDRARRYETANGLAADVRRYLESEPVSAGPPSAAYKLRKFVSRHRAVTITAGLIAAALVCSTAIALWGLQRSLDSEAKAIKERDRAEAATRTAESALTRAQDSERTAQAQSRRAQSTTAFLLSILEAPSPYNDGRNITIAGLMEFASQRAAVALRDEPVELARVRQALTSAFVFLGDPARAELEIRSAIDGDVRAGDPDKRLRWELMIAHSYRLVEVARRAEAVELADRIVTEIRASGVDVPDVEEDAMLHVGWLRGGEGRLDLVHEVLRRRTARLGPDHPAVKGFEYHLAAALVAVGRAAEAIPYFRRDLEWRKRNDGEDSAHTAASHDALGWGLLRAGNYAEAAEVLRICVEKSNRVFGIDNPQTLQSKGHLAFALDKLERWEELEAVADEALALQLASNPEAGRVEGFAKFLATARLALGRTDEAREPCEIYLQRVAAAPPAGQAPSGPREWNEFTWILVGSPCIDVLPPERRREFAALAAPLAERAVLEGAADERHWMFLDTLAMVRFRQDNFGEAVRLQKEAIAGMRSAKGPIQQEAKVLARLKQFEEALAAANAGAPTEKP